MLFLLCIGLAMGGGGAELLNGIDFLSFQDLEGDDQGVSISRLKLHLHVDYI